MEKYTLVEVNDKKTRKGFLMFPVRLYKNEKNYIRPLDEDVEKVFDAKINKSFRNGECIRWLLTDSNGETVGRVAAFIDRNTAFRQDQPTGGMGFFECVNDTKAAFLLFDAAKQWLAAKGMEAKRVFVTGVQAGNYPHERSVGRLNDIEEERRVLYVALTRAQNELILTGQLRSSLSYGSINTEDTDSKDQDALSDASYANLLFFLAELPKKFVVRSVEGYSRASSPRSLGGAQTKDAPPLRLGPEVV